MQEQKRYRYSTDGCRVKSEWAEVKAEVEEVQLLPRLCARSRPCPSPRSSLATRSSRHSCNITTVYLQEGSVQGFSAMSSLSIQDGPRPTVGPGQRLECSLQLGQTSEVYAVCSESVVSIDVDGSMGRRQALLISSPPSALSS